MRYGIGDVHGCYGKLKALLEDQLSVSKNDEIYCVGDIISKGKENLEVLEYFMDLQKRGFNIRSVLGNHEYRILYLYHTDFDLLEKYLERYNCLDILSGEVNSIINLLESFPFYIELEDWIISHSFFDFTGASQSDVRNMLGHKNFKNISLDSLLNKKQLFGHRVVSIDHLLKTLSQGDDQINIDTGCVYNEDYGLLTAINLDTHEITSN